MRSLPLLRAAAFGLLFAFPAAAWCQRNLVPDGTSLSDTFSTTGTFWYVVELEKAKGYNLEVLDLNDASSNDIVVTVYNSDMTTPFNGGTVDCQQGEAAPSMTASGAGADGIRCSIYVTSGVPDTTLATIRVDRILGADGTPLRIRMRENNLIARWTTNGYNMFVALQNNTAFTVTGYVLYYPTGATHSNSFATFDAFSINPYDNVQFSHPAGSIATNRGMVRIAVSAGTDVNAQVYAFNTGSGTYLFFTPEKPNHGSGNSW